jgi:DNA primase
VAGQGRFRDEDVTAVREKSQIADVIGEHVALQNAGGGNLKGICPFHDEKSPSLSVSPSRGLFHCFGCSAGGDVIRFVERIENVSFTEAVEMLARRANIELRYVDGGFAPKQSQGARARLIDAHAAAAEFYVDQLRSTEAMPAREFLAERGFDQNVAQAFGCGFAPSGWDALTKHLLARKFTEAELDKAGLARRSSRGTLIDRFHRRLLWPIRDVSGEVVGFGARKIFDDDPIAAKYLNTPDTPIYHKGQLLYGADMARKEIARQHQVVIVEGYTDVMACHLAGVTTAVATCGTAFGTDHVSVLRRLLMDSDTYRGSVIFTFDGDAAGMKAAERAFGDDQKFMAQTFVAIEPNGLDPCELRQKSGDEAVRDLVARRVALVEFVLRSTVARHDLDTAEGRVAALEQGVPMVARIKDHALRDEYARRLAGLVGVDDPNRIVQRVRGLVRSEDARNSRPDAKPGLSGTRPTPNDNATSDKPAVRPKVVVDDNVVRVEREVLKIALQRPSLAGPDFDQLPEDAFLVPMHREIRAAIASVGGTNASVSGPQWAAAVAEYLSEEARVVASGIGVERLHTREGSTVEHYAAIQLARVQEMYVGRRVARLKAQVQRTNPLESDDHHKLFAELISLETHLRSLRERAIGGL